MASRQNLVVLNADIWYQVFKELFDISLFSTDDWRDYTSATAISREMERRLIRSWMKPTRLVSKSFHDIITPIMFRIMNIGHVCFFMGHPIFRGNEEAIAMNHICQFTKDLTLPYQSDPEMIVEMAYLIFSSQQLTRVVYETPSTVDEILAAILSNLNRRSIICGEDSRELYRTASMFLRAFTANTRRRCRLYIEDLIRIEITEPTLSKRGKKFHVLDLEDGDSQAIARTSEHDSNSHRQPLDLLELRCFRLSDLECYPWSFEAVIRPMTKLKIISSDIRGFALRYDERFPLWDFSCLRSLSLHHPGSINTLEPIPHEALARLHTFKLVISGNTHPLDEEIAKETIKFMLMALKAVQNLKLTMDFMKYIHMDTVLRLGPKLRKLRLLYPSSRIRRLQASVFQIECINKQCPLVTDLGLNLCVGCPETPHFLKALSKFSGLRKLELWAFSMSPSSILGVEPTSPDPDYDLAWKVITLLCAAKIGTPFELVQIHFFPGSDAFSAWERLFEYRLSFDGTMERRGSPRM